MSKGCAVVRGTVCITTWHCALKHLLTLGAYAPEGYGPCFVCLSVCYHSSGGSFHFKAQTKVQTALVRYSLDLSLVDFRRNASFRSYGIICLP